MTQLVHHHTRRTIVVFCLVLILLALVAGCTSGSGDSDAIDDTQSGLTTTDVEVRLAGLSTPTQRYVEVLVDNQDANVTQTGTWEVSSAPDPWADQSIYSKTTDATLRWTPELPVAGTYRVYAWWTSHTNRSTTVPYHIHHADGTTTVTVEQRDPALGGQWNLLGSFAFTPGEDNAVEVSGSQGQANADAVRFVLDTPARSRSATVWELNPEFAVNAHDMYLIITGSGFDEMRKEMSLESGLGTFAVPVGDNRTFQIEVLNQSGRLVYQSPGQTINVIAGKTLEVEVVLDPVELRVPLLSVSHDNPGQEMVFAIDDTESPLDGLRVTIPAAATNQPLDMGVTEVYNPADIPLPDDQAGVIIDMNPSDVSFVSPVTVEFPYDDPLLHVLGIDESTLRVNIFEPSTGEWVPVPNQSVDTERNLIVAQLTHFSFFMITYDPTRVPTPPASTPNQDPVVMHPGSQRTGEGTIVPLAIQATDADGDALTYSAKGLPAGLSIHITTGQITGTIASSAVSTPSYLVTVKVSDGVAESSTVFTWTVSDPILVVSWKPPSTNRDDTALLDLARYRLHYGRTSRGSKTKPSQFNYQSTLDIPEPGATSVSLPAPKLAGRYYFSMTAIDLAGNESDFSQEITLDIP